MYRNRRLVPATALVVGLTLAPLRAVMAMPTDAAPAPAPYFTAVQAAQGRLSYAKSCGVCHGANLEGAAGVALGGAAFAKSWGNGRHQARDFYDVIAQQMPKNAPGSLSEAENLAIVAFILSKNGYVAGSQPLQLASLTGVLAAAASAATTPAAPTSAAATSAAATSTANSATAGSHGSQPAATTRAAGASASSPQFPQPPVHIESAVRFAPIDADLLHIQHGDWLTYNRTLAGDRYSPLDQITTRNVSRLQPKCVLQLGELGSFEPSPIAYQGHLYLTTAHKVAAVDGATCALLWSYTYVPVDPEHLPGNRGVALYRGRVIRGTTDGHLIALDAENGRLLWDVRVADGALGYEITGAPVAFDGKVFTGDAGADVGINGRVYAFDVSTGALIWAFDTVPTGNQPGAETWGGGAEHGGGSTWSSMAIDPQSRLLFVPIGNPAPDFHDAGRPGANLYTNSVVALSLDTGQLAWYVQQVPHDVHDWDTAAAPALFEQNGRRYMAVASKNGLLYLYDRDSHATLAETPFATRENVDVPLSKDHPVHVCPGALGQYNGPAYSPKSRMLFLGSADRCNTIQVAEPKYVAGSVYFGGRFIMDPPDKHSGWIRGFDAATGREIWNVHRSATILAGVTPTAGGVLFTGDTGGTFLALDAKTGKVLYSFTTGGAIAAGITTYLAAGKQYVAVPSGSSSRDAASATAAATLVLFALP
jgi:PQQ-dependent dehydrogenase (methanol/ethanol family)